MMDEKPLYDHLLNVLLIKEGMNLRELFKSRFSPNNQLPCLPLSMSGASPLLSSRRFF
jgi:hypothetical protein